TLPRERRPRRHGHSVAAEGTRNSRLSVDAAEQPTSTVRACRRHSAYGGPAGHRRWAAIRDHLGHAPAIPSAWRVRASAPATPAAPAGPYHGRGMVVRWSPPGRGHTGGT